MYKENIPDSQQTNGSKATELRERFQDLVAEGHTHSVSSLNWLNSFKQRFHQPKEEDITIGYSQGGKG